MAGSDGFKRRKKAITPKGGHTNDNANLHGQAGANQTQRIPAQAHTNPAQARQMSCRLIQ